MQTLSVFVVLVATMVPQGTAQLPCKLCPVSYATIRNLSTHTRTRARAHTHTHTYTCTQHVVGPDFHLSQYQTAEGETEAARLSAPILTRPYFPAFTGSIEVDITAEDLPSGNPRRNALFGKCLKCPVYVCYCPFSTV